MLLLIFSGLIVLLELCALSYHEARRNRRCPTYLTLQDHRYRHKLHEPADRDLATMLLTPQPADSKETPDFPGLLKNPRSESRWGDLGERLL